MFLHRKLVFHFWQEMLATPSLDTESLPDIGKSANRQEQNSPICSPSCSQKPPSSLWPWLISTEAQSFPTICSVVPLSLTSSQWNIAPSLCHIITSEIHSAMTVITATVCSGEIKTAWWEKMASGVGALQWEKRHQEGKTFGFRMCFAQMLYMLI